ncbi:hypothetical protein F9K85_08795 [Brucella tritici]|uniref:hypothetical protein n=1 Tax=Brucella tritici TaxID=94626 RepID=UPI00124CE375|nr:hypothetical protein [Brucella tritici]KAB2676891.1 hypothetical protein F9K85_08795 [Brucella tritici]
MNIYQNISIIVIYFDILKLLRTVFSGGKSRILSEAASEFSKGHLNIQTLLEVMDGAITLTTRDVNGAKEPVRSFQFLFPFGDERFCGAFQLTSSELPVGFHAELSRLGR